MTNSEAVNWIINLSADIGKVEHRDLWHYEQALSEIREMLESAQPGISREELFEELNRINLPVGNETVDKIFSVIENIPSAQPETCEGCKHLGKWENEFEYGYPSPCTYCKRRVGDHYER